MAASGSKWQQVAARGSKWQQRAASCSKRQREAFKITVYQSVIKCSMPLRHCSIRFWQIKLSLKLFCSVNQKIFYFLQYSIFRHTILKLLPHKRIQDLAIVPASNVFSYNFFVNFLIVFKELHKLSRNERI